MHVDVLPGLDRLNDPADFAAVFDCRVADGEIPKRKLVAQRNILVRFRRQSLVRPEIASDAVGARRDIDDRNSNRIRRIMH
jgi:hypothetical protein